MDFSTDYSAVFESHKANDQFEGHDRFRFEPGTRGFSAANAWWLAELSRWAYVGCRSRAAAMLQRAGLRETGFVSLKGTHCAVVQSSDRQFAVVVFRGTTETRNWITNAHLMPRRDDAHAGYETAIARLWPLVTRLLEPLDCPVFVTGHSMGAALATLCGRRFPVAGVYAFGSPPVGNAALASELDDAPIYRVVNYRDIATRGLVALAHRHVGQLCYLSHDHALWMNPSRAAIRSDQKRGPRLITRRLNAHRRFPLPESLTDHAPVNYTAHLERFAASPVELPQVDCAVVA